MRTARSRAPTAISNGRSATPCCCAARMTSTIWRLGGPTSSAAAVRGASTGPDGRNHCRSHVRAMPWPGETVRIVANRKSAFAICKRNVAISIVFAVFSQFALARRLRKGVTKGGCRFAGNYPSHRSTNGARRSGGAHSQARESRGCVAATPALGPAQVCQGYDSSIEGVRSKTLCDHAVAADCTPDRRAARRYRNHRADFREQ